MMLRPETTWGEIQDGFDDLVLNGAARDNKFLGLSREEIFARPEGELVYSISRPVPAAEAEVDTNVISE